MQCEDRNYPALGRKFLIEWSSCPMWCNLLMRSHYLIGWIILTSPEEVIATQFFLGLRGVRCGAPTCIILTKFVRVEWTPWCVRRVIRSVLPSCHLLCFLGYIQIDAEMGDSKWGLKNKGLLKTTYSLLYTLLFF